MNTTTKELEIMQTAERLRELGVPDDLNRWLKMTPETLLANQRARAKINKQLADGSPVRHEKRGRSTISAGHAANLDDTGKAILKEVTKEARAKQTARLRDLKEQKSMSKVGAKESQLRAARESTKTTTAADAADSKESTVRKTSKKTKTTKTAAARTPVKGKTTKAKPASAKPAKTAANDGPRPGSKLAIIQGLLTRPEGCTTKQVLEACEWPAVSMPQQARALGVELKKEKVDGVTVYRAA